MQPHPGVARNAEKMVGQTWKNRLLLGKANFIKFSKIVAKFGKK